MGIVSKKSQPKENGMATAGIVLSVIGIVIFIFSVLFFIFSGQLADILYELSYYDYDLYY